jgi:hypothetical protein
MRDATDWKRADSSANHQIDDETRVPSGIAVIPLLALQSLLSVQTACLPLRFQLRLKIKTCICAKLWAEKGRDCHNSPMFSG